MSSFLTKPPAQKAYSSYIRQLNRQKPPIDEEQLEELKEAFTLFDTEHCGKIDYREFKAAMRALGYEIRKQDVEKCFKDVDKDLSHSITFEEFVKIVTPRLHPKNSKEEIMKVFKLFDNDNTG